MITFEDYSAKVQAILVNRGFGPQTAAGSVKRNESWIDKCWREGDLPDFAASVIVESSE